MNSIGRLFRVSLFGESHGALAGVLIDGCPAGLALCAKDFEADLQRRKSSLPGGTARREKDEITISSGIYKGFSTGAPIQISFANQDVESRDYNAFLEHPRPGHADFASRLKYHGFHDLRGAGHLSARLTVGLVAAGVIAKKLLAPAEISAELLSVGGSDDIEKQVLAAMADHDSLGGIIKCTVQNLAAGLGEPYMDSVESLISHLVFAIPSVKGIEFGAGFASANLRGSQMNDAITDASGKTSTNHSGGINGGITNGNEISFRVALRPAPSIGREQQSWHFGKGKMQSLKIAGRHDVCPALRAPVIIEAAAAIVLADLSLINQCSSREKV
ncbi:MAG: chorismate synthase [Candidatus Cloacimonadaceae bacterium]|nr:chorismate synthase [Candidatus Cloacimonadaceae bacterium]